MFGFRVCPFPDNTIITGGAIASMLMGEEVKDYDLYFRTGDACFEVAKHFVNQFTQNPPPRFKADDKKTVDITVTKEADRVRTVVKSAGVASEEPADEYQYFEATDPGSGRRCPWPGLGWRRRGSSPPGSGRDAAAGSITTKRIRVECERRTGTTPPGALANQIERRSSWLRRILA